MSLATRCPACSTVFRVVQDQLKVSGGWVRCGHCHEVFNGLQSLFELPPEATSPIPAPTPPRAPPVAPPTVPLSSFTPSAPGLFVSRPAEPSAVDLWGPTEPAALDDIGETVNLADEPVEDEDEPIGFEPPPVALDVPAVDGWAPAPVADDVPEPWVEAPASEFEAAATTDSKAHWEARGEDATALAVDDPAPEPPEAPSSLPAITLTGDAPFAPPAPVTADEPVPLAKPRRRKRQRKPSFMREAERAAIWRKPAMRAVLGSAALALSGLLTLQVVHAERDELAARWPALTAPLSRWCEWASCQLQPPRALANLVLDSSGLAQTGTPEVLRFEAELRNTADHVVRAPALELSFSDNLGHQLVRKVLLPDQMSAPPSGLMPDHPWHIDVPLRVGKLPVAGFTAEVFYP